MKKTENGKELEGSLITEEITIIINITVAFRHTGKYRHFVKI